MFSFVCCCFRTNKKPPTKNSEQKTETLSNEEQYTIAPTTTNLKNSTVQALTQLSASNGNDHYVTPDRLDAPTSEPANQIHYEDCLRVDELDDINKKRSRRLRRKKFYKLRTISSLQTKPNESQVQSKNSDNEDSEDNEDEDEENYMIGDGQSNHSGDKPELWPTTSARMTEPTESREECDRATLNYSHKCHSSLESIIVGSTTNDNELRPLATESSLTNRRASSPNFDTSHKCTKTTFV